MTKHTLDKTVYKKKVLPLPWTNIKRRLDMNTMNVSAEVLRQLGYIADDEDCMKKVLRAIQDIIATHKVAYTQVCEPEVDSKEYILNGMKEAFMQVNDIRSGRIQGRPAEELLKEL